MGGGIGNRHLIQQAGTRLARPLEVGGIQVPVPLFSLLCHDDDDDNDDNDDDEDYENSDDDDGRWRS